MSYSSFADVEVTLHVAQGEVCRAGSTAPVPVELGKVE